MPSGKLRIATCQFPETFTPSRNAAMALRLIDRAAAEGADLVHFHECALSGYGGPVATAAYDWAALREATESIMAAARKHELWVALGSSHQLTRKRRPHNCVYLISAAGKIVDRYDKRFCTRRDLEDYSPGDHFVTFTLAGVKCAILICYDYRFPEMYRTLYTQGVRVMLHSFHNAGAPGPGVLTHVTRSTIQGHAGVNAMWVSAPNSSTHYQLWPSVFVTPDGLIAAACRRHRTGIIVNTVDLARDYYDATKPYRDRAIRGVLHSGRPVSDPRSEDRRCL